MDTNSHAASLEQRGWALIEGLKSTDEAEARLREFGALMPQYDGSHMAHVKARQNYSNLPVSGSTAEIGPHTDGIAMKRPPRLLALYCFEPAGCGGGHTNLADGYEMIRSLNRENLDYCRHQRFLFRTEGKLLREKEHSSAHSILETDEKSGKLRINFSHNYFCWGDLNPVSDEHKPRHIGQLGQVVTSIMDFFQRSKKPILVPKNALLIWDNQRMLHSRDAFSDSRRHLVRYWIS